MKATIEVDVKGSEALDLIIRTLGYMTGVDGFTLSLEDECGNLWSHAGQGAVIDVGRPADSAAVVLEKLAETLEEWGRNVEYNNHEKVDLWKGRANGFRQAALEARRRKKELTK
jgi:hypothetical protein